MNRPQTVFNVVIYSAAALNQAEEPVLNVYKTIIVSMYMCVLHWGVMVSLRGVFQGVSVNALNQLASM